MLLLKRILLDMFECKLSAMGQSVKGLINID